MAVSSKENEIYIMEFQSDVKRSNFPKVPTQLYHDRTRTVNQTSISHFVKQARIPSLLLVTFSLAAYRVIHCFFFFLKYNYFILGKSILFCNFTLKQTTHGLMANRGLQLAAAEEQRRTLIQFMLLCDNLLWSCSLAAGGVRASLGSCPYSEADAVCWGEFTAGISATLTAWDGVAFAFLPSPHPHKLAAASSLGPASSETIPCMPCWALMRGADFCSLQVTLGFSKQQLGVQNVAVVAALSCGQGFTAVFGQWQSAWARGYFALPQGLKSLCKSLWSYWRTCDAAMGFEFDPKCQFTLFVFCSLACEYETVLSEPLENILNVQICTMIVLSSKQYGFGYMLKYPPVCCRHIPLWSCMCCLYVFSWHCEHWGFLSSFSTVL